jgi:hypothetical protein
MINIKVGGYYRDPDTMTRWATQGLDILKVIAIHEKGIQYVWVDTPDSPTITSVSGSDWIHIPGYGTPLWEMLNE